MTIWIARNLTGFALVVAGLILFLLWGTILVLSVFLIEYPSYRYEKAMIIFGTATFFLFVALIGHFQSERRGERDTLLLCAFCSKHNL